MTVTVGTSATYRDLILLDDVKSDLGITGSSEDGNLALAIQRVTSIVQDHCQRTFAKETVTETKGSFGSNYMCLSRRPIVSIISVSQDGTTISSTKYSIDDANAGIVWNEKGWGRTDIYSHYIESTPTHNAKRDWSFTYVAGYEMPASTGITTLPGAVQQAAFDTVKAVWKGRRADPNVLRERIGDASKTNFGSPRSVPKTAEILLEKYVNYDLT